MTLARVRAFQGVRQEIHHDPVADDEPFFPFPRAVVEKRDLPVVGKPRKLARFVGIEQAEPFHRLLGNGLEAGRRIHLGQHEALRVHAEQLVDQGAAGTGEGMEYGDCTQRDRTWLKGLGSCRSGVWRYPGNDAITSTACW